MSGEAHNSQAALARLSLYSSPLSLSRALSLYRTNRTGVRMADALSLYNTLSVLQKYREHPQQGYSASAHSDATPIRTQ